MQNHDRVQSAYKEISQKQRFWESRFQIFSGAYPQTPLLILNYDMNNSLWCNDVSKSVYSPGAWAGVKNMGALQQTKRRLSHYWRVLRQSK